jgi:hypothetical protein
MPVCEGRPNGPCPLAKNDKTVHLTQGDLMLCDACEKFRFPEFGGRSKNVGGKTGTCATTSGSSTVDNATPTPSPKVMLNELLTYATFYRNRSASSSLYKVMADFYTATEIGVCKKLLITEFSSELHDCALKSERRTTSSRPAHYAELEDILGILDTLDNKNALARVKYCAAALDRLPKYGPEEINLCAVVDRQVHTDATVEAIKLKIDTMSVNSATSDISTAAMQQTQQSIDLLNRQFHLFQQDVTSRINLLHDTCAKLSTSAAQNVTVANNSNNANNVRDRALNVIIFGIQEDKNVNTWHAAVMDVLKFVASRDIEVNDLFRPGRYRSDKMRPIIVKLKSYWDKRILLSNSYKLKDYGSRVFLASDEPPDVQRQNTLERLKARAERQGKQVNVQDGVLAIDGIPMYSLISGFIRNENV